ncbi:Basic-leucine zipper domain [Dillenia turbinata]|uniref:Basic-leucine zipper domain n=1 Tax=Dillenia turbinata TaxID=194707 RepID=A0AAN8ZMN2_9MAGN
MGSNINFRNFGNEPLGGDGLREMGNYPLARQSSIYSLTFDEFQNTMGGIGKDFGSMNMDELLKNICSAEELQIVATATAANTHQGGISGQSGGYLQRQGSLTLPRTLSTKTVDEVWKDIYKEFSGGKELGSNSGSNLPQRQQTLGEMTLEEFLVRAGVVREDAPIAGKANNGGFYAELARNDNNNGLGIAFQQKGIVGGMIGNRIADSNDQISFQSHNLPLNVNGARSSQQQLSLSQQPQQQMQSLFPKQATVAYSTPIAVPGSVQFGSPEIRAGIVGISDPAINGNLVPGIAPQGGMSMVGLGAGAVTVASGSPANPLSSDGLAKSNGDTSSVSPSPYVFNGGIRGRKSSGAIEKVIERRQRRMIKNRESAARSRARKQAYTMELEAEVAKLKAENQELKKKQAEMLEMQKNQLHNLAIP